MARTRKTEPEIKVTAAAAAAPARRKTTSAPRTVRPTEAPMPAVEIEAPVVATETVTVKYVPKAEEISALAYSYWVARNYHPGNQEEDWLRAEQELIQRAL
jgi:hypothetical protein